MLFLQTERNGDPIVSHSALVIFDVDGTLFQTYRVTAPAVQRTFKRFGIHPPDADTIRSFIGKHPDIYYQWLRDACGDGPVEEIIAETDACEIRLISEVGALYLGAKETLEALESAGHAQAVSSNAPEPYLHEVLHVYNLWPFFSVVRCPGSIFADKAEMVRDIMAHLPQRPVIVIGDRREDIESAHANGVIAVGAAYGLGSPGELAEADLLVKDAHEIPGAVDRLLA
jgi:phosphoglycolate phosphatase